MTAMTLLSGFALAVAILAIAFGGACLFDKFMDYYEGRKS